MQFLYDYGLFLAKAITIVIAILLVIGGLMRARQRHHSQTPGDIEIRNLSDEYEDVTDTMRVNVLDEDDYKAWHKEQEKKEKEEAKAKKKAAKNKKDDDAEDDDDERKPRLFVLNFLGDMEASSVHCLREEITAVLSIAEECDEVMLRLESPGGLVHSYGHAASQLQRIRDAKIKLTVAVDEVAASGGYMMACVADKIVAAPFAVIGSIGVVAEIPNFHRLLQRFDVDYEQHTAGQYKRTLTIFGQNTEEGRKKFQQELEDTHLLFKQFIHEHRPAVDIEKVATGEHWYGTQAIQMGLIDEIITSDGLLQSLYDTHDVYEVNYEFRKTWADRFAFAAQMSVDKLLTRWLSKASNKQNYIR